MAGLDKHRTLITPGQGLMLVLALVGVYCWYNGIDIFYHLNQFREGLFQMLGMGV